MARTATKIAGSIAPQVGASTIANMEGRTNTEAATASRQVGLKTGTNYSGQYLYDRFVANDKTEVTKLEIVRKMVGVLEVDDFKAAINGMVEIAASYRDKAIDEQKEAEGKEYNKDKPSADVAAYAARHKTALNHQTVMRLAYGALRFAADGLASHGYNEETTGYQVMAVISRKTLADAGIKWDGTKIPAKTEVDRRKANQAETKALEKVMADEPRKDGEALGTYLTRVEAKVNAQLAKDNAERESKMVDDMAKKIRAMAGAMLDDVLEKLLAMANEPAPTLDPDAAKEAAPQATKH